MGQLTARESFMLDVTLSIFQVRNHQLSPSLCLKERFLVLFLQVFLPVCQLLRREERFQSLQFCLLVEELGVEVHEFVLEFPEVEFDLVVFLLGVLYFGGYLFFVLNYCKVTCSISRSSSWCRLSSSAILPSSSSHSRPAPSLPRSSARCSFSRSRLSSSSLKMFCWLYLRLAARAKTLLVGSGLSCRAILGKKGESRAFRLGLQIELIMFSVFIYIIQQSLGYPHLTSLHFTYKQPPYSAVQFSAGRLSNAKIGRTGRLQYFTGGRQFSLEAGFNKEGSGINNANNIFRAYINPMDQQPKPAPENPQNQELDNMNPAMSSVPSFQSLNSMNGEGRESKAEGEEGEGEELQIVQTKSDKRINHEEILRMFNEQIEKEERERQEIELKRRESLKSKGKTVQKPAPKKASNDDRRLNKENSNEAALKALSEKSNRIKKRIEEHCKQYKSMYRPSIYDTKMQKFRFECKEKLFFSLCYGFEELRELSKEELSEGEQAVLGRNCYEVCRKAAFEIDLEMVKLLNKGDRHDISREYKQQFETLLNNIKDEANCELKRRILNGSFPPSRVAVANEIDFFTTAKREEILEKQKRYIAEFTVENVLQPFKDEENEDIQERPKAEEGPREEAPALKPQKSGFANKYLEESSILQLEELLSGNQLEKMLNRLEEDLQGQSRTLLIANFKEVFGI